MNSTSSLSDQALISLANEISINSNFTTSTQVLYGKTYTQGFFEPNTQTRSKIVETLQDLENHLLEVDDFSLETTQIITKILNAFGESVIIPFIQTYNINDEEIQSILFILNSINTIIFNHLGMSTKNNEFALSIEDGFMNCGFELVELSRVYSAHVTKLSKIVTKLKTFVGYS